MAIEPAQVDPSCQIEAARGPPRELDLTLVVALGSLRPEAPPRPGPGGGAPPEPGVIACRETDVTGWPPHRRAVNTLFQH